MNRLFLFLVFGLLILGVVSGGDEKISVIVMPDKNENKMKASVNPDIKEMKIIREYSSFDGFVVEIYASDLDKLKEKFGDAVFVDDRRYSATLDLSSPKIGANASWRLKTDGINISGAGQTICIIDTGVNYSHVALGGCYGGNNPNSNCRVLGGYDYINDDDYPLDDNGHGTHVAGIVASNDSTYKGVAPNSKIIAIKALDDNGDGTPSDIISGIDWCVSNASVFNISVISMSLGDNSTYNEYCVSALWDSAVDAAVAAGISVVVSSGNCDRTGQTNCTIGVAVPACIEGVTRVGAVDDADSLSGFGTGGNGFMRGALFQLMAPGVGITSTLYSGNFGSLSGTSMSAPHVSGAIALIKQHLELSGQSKSVGEIEVVLNNTGVRLDDSLGSGYNFTRIDVYDAILSLDNVAPDVTLTSPVDNHINLSINQSFSCNASDWQLANVTFKIWNSGGLYYNESKFFSGVGNLTSFNLIGLGEGNYEWNCEVRDSIGNFDVAVSNFSLTVGGLEVDLNSPVNNSYTNLGGINFSCSSRSDVSYELVNTTFKIWNSSGALVFNESENISGFENVTNFSFSFSVEDNYLWGCDVFNNNSDRRNSVNFSIGYDLSEPYITGLDVNGDTDSATISWATDELSNSSVWVSGGSWTNSSSNVISHSVSVSGLVASTGYNYVVWSCDRASNCESDSGNFTTDAEEEDGGGSGSGGSSSSSSSSSVEKKVTPATYKVGDDEFSRGYSKMLREGGGLTFRFSDLDDDWHSLNVDEVGNNYVDIVVRSEPVEVRLFVGEDKKLNLSSAEYYDLLVGLEGVSGELANLTIQKINETLPASEEDAVSENGGYFWIVVFVLVSVAIVLGALLLGHKKVKRIKHKKHVVIVRHRDYHG